MLKDWRFAFGVFLGGLCLLAAFGCAYADNPRPYPANTLLVIPRYTSNQYDTSLMQMYYRVKSNDMGQRIASFSEFFLNRPYLLNPLGEGPNAQFDKSPLYRTDAFDCVTFVSTVLALAQSSNFTAFQKNIIAVRYTNSIPLFATRNHFICIDWNLYNRKKGFIKDITNQFPLKPKTAVAIINKPSWSQKLGAGNIKTFSALLPQAKQAIINQLHQQFAKTPIKTSRLSYLPLSGLFYRTSSGTIEANMSVFDQIPNGAIIEIVRANRDLTREIGTHLNIVHMGFAIQTPQGLMFRNASSVAGKVTDMPLVDYLKVAFMHLKYPQNAGIHIEMPS